MSVYGQDSLRFTALPTELLLRVYEELPSFSDALNLRASCHTLLDIWTDHRNTIAKGIVIDRIYCYRHARQLLAEQWFHPRMWRPKLDTDRRHKGALVQQNDLSDSDLFALDQNAKRIEQIIKAIEREVIPGLSVDGLPKSKKHTIYGGADVHPANLTQTERLRVVRACYQLWHLSLFDEKHVVQKHICSMRPRELFYFNELGNCIILMGFETRITGSLMDCAKGLMVAFIRLCDEYYGGRRPELPRDRASKYMVVVWDHWQDNLKSLVCGRPMSDLRRDAQGEKLEHLWDYEEGDELLVVDD
ncbi:hypothetical protein BDV95DRAFT_597996 [Massariosphaeria phaeospora]|uniref:F-box domain-containing protein n=1 Tax=Massariosphaeria phaeospora TaxID=100035 RepID=A0A7C8I2T2_9PLEO|nr:hypothetical protein BDV95DRAFT_597996 [Massariosphaeria phaeospora]